MERLLFFDKIREGNKVYFFSPEHGCFFEGDLDGGKSIYFNSPEDYSFNKIGNYICYELYGDKIFCFPTSDEKIDVYYIGSKDIAHLDLNNINKKGYYFFSSCIMGKSIIGLPGRYPAIVVINGDTLESHEIILDKSEISSEEADPTDVLLTRSHHCYRNHVYVGSRHTNTIISVDIESMNISYYRGVYNKTNVGCRYICGEDKTFYMIDTLGCVHKYVIENDSIEEISNTVEKELIIEDSGYIDCAFIDEKIVLTEHNDILAYDISQKKVIRTNIVGDVNDSLLPGCIYLRRCDDGLEYMNSNDRTIHILNSSLECVNDISYTIDEAEISKIRPFKLVNETIDSSVANLNAFARMIANM